MVKLYYTSLTVQNDLLEANRNFHKLSPDDEIIMAID